MNTRIDDGLHHQVVRGLQVLWLAFAGSIVLYTFILMLVAEWSEPVESDFVDFLRPIFWVVAVVLAITSLLWRQQAPDLKQIRRRTTASSFARLRVACIITWSLCEGIAILGLVLGALTFEALDYVPLISLALIMLFLNRPDVWPIAHFLEEDFR